MTDLVTRLRALADIWEGASHIPHVRVLREAADALDGRMVSIIDERNALKAKLAGNKAFQCAQACDPAMIEIERLNRETHRLAARAEEAEAKLAEAEQRIARRAEHPSNAEKLADRVRVYKGKARRQKERAEKAEAEAAALREVAEAALETRPSHLCKECVTRCYDCTQNEWKLSRALAALEEKP